MWLPSIKATKISNILAGEPRSYARLASSLSVDNLNADDAKYQLHERWGLPKEQVNEVVNLFV